MLFGGIIVKFVKNSQGYVYLMYHQQSALIVISKIPFW